MLTRLDHIVLLTDQNHRTVGDYSTLMGAPPQWSNSDGHLATDLFLTKNTGLEIISPCGPHEYDYVRDILNGKNSSLTSLAFSTDNLDESHHIFARRGLKPGDITDIRNNRRKFRCPDQLCHGIKTFILSECHNENPNPKPSEISLGHIVINTPNPDRAIAHYGARLGIRFALDRTNEDWGARFLFFKLGDIVLEVIHRLDKDHDLSDPDKIWGLTWKVDDLEAHHSRLSEAGVTVSDIRTGRKPGTRVFSVKSHTDGIPTLFLANS